jgi:hypothetical protein
MDICKGDVFSKGKRRKLLVHSGICMVYSDFKSSAGFWIHGTPSSENLREYILFLGCRQNRVVLATASERGCYGCSAFYCIFGSSCIDSIEHDVKMWRYEGMNNNRSDWKPFIKDAHAHGSEYASKGMGD